MRSPRLPWNHEKVIARFWGKVRKCPSCDCWLFEGSMYRGWGRLKTWGFPGCESGVVKAHRYAYALEHGALEPEDDIHHNHDKCKHRNCVNVAHLDSINHDEHGEVSQSHQMKEIDAWAEVEYLHPII